MNILKPASINTRRLKFVHSYVDRNGHPRHYLRRKGSPKIVLPGAYGSQEFLATYWSYVNDPATIPEPAELPSKKGEFVYFLRTGDRIKIGRSTNPGERLKSLKTGLPMKMDSFVVVNGSASDEKRLHALLAVDRVAGEWFKATGAVLDVMHRCLRFGQVKFEQPPQLARRRRHIDGSPA